jgi:hypothetical protein
MGPFLSQLNPFRILKSNLSNINLIVLLSSHERLFLPTDLFALDFRNKILYAFFSSRLYTLHAKIHLIHL